ncbi:MAG TPA: hypothetical protein DDX71_04015 [Ruminococcus sp.]|nr:hypothetical protein [Ruminococcus sp.]
MRVQKGEYIAAFLFGFFAYGLFEIAGRGYTHWSMGLLGGISMMLLYSMQLPRRTAALLGAVFVTCAEFTAGILENRILGWAVWDYSGLPLNFMGQICPLYSAVWFVLCRFALIICGKMRDAYAVRD